MGWARYFVARGNVSATAWERFSVRLSLTVTRARIGWERLDALVAAYKGHNRIVKGCDSGLRFAP
jgi:hypothetical protein